MKIGIGLPATLPTADPAEIPAWAMRAEDLGFSTLGVIDRLVYGNVEPLIALTAAAAVTSSIGLMTSVLIAPLRANTALLAKQAASLDAISNGRLVLGLAIGGRDDDFEASGLEVRGRGARLDSQIDELREIWGGASRGFAGAIGPTPKRHGGPSILIGGVADAAIDRAVRLGDGWIGGGPPDRFARTAEVIGDAWKRANRAGQPHNVAQTYFALGPDARDVAREYLLDYYAIAGPFAEQVAQSAVVDEASVRLEVESLAAAGCSEIIFSPCAPGLDQLDRLADALEAAGISGDSR